MTTRIHVYADYVCPYCLLAEHVVTEAVGEEDVAIQWHPFELRPDPVPTLRVDAAYLPTVWRQSVYPLAERIGVDIQLPTTSPQPRTALAFQAFAHAEERGKGHAFSMRAMEAFFQENRDIGDIDVIVDLGREIGLDVHVLRDALESGRYADQHARALRHASEERGVRAVPTIVIGDARFEGMPAPADIRAAVHKAKALNDADQNSDDIRRCET